MRGIGTALTVIAVLFVVSCNGGGSGVVSAGQRSSADALPVVQSASADRIVEIKEKMFISQVNDVYLNPEDYAGKTIRLEGLFKEEDYGREEPYCFVLRYGPGCCGADGNAGFEVAWDAPQDTDKTYPGTDDWVEAVGTLKSYEEDGASYLYLSLSSLKVLDERGAEFVTQ